MKKKLSAKRSTKRGAGRSERGLAQGVGRPDVPTVYQKKELERLQEEAEHILPDGAGVFCNVLG